MIPLANIRSTESERALDGEPASTLSPGQAFAGKYALDLEDEGWRRHEGRQQRSGRVEQGAAADLATILALDHGLTDRRSSQYTSQAAAVLELLKQVARLDLEGAIDQDRIIRGECRPARFERAAHHRHVGGAKFAEERAASLGAGRIVIERDHRVSKPRENGGRVAGAAGDVENPRIRPEFERLDEARQHHRF